MNGIHQKAIIAGNQKINSKANRLAIKWFKKNNKLMCLFYTLILLDLLSKI